MGVFRRKVRATRTKLSAVSARESAHSDQAIQVAVRRLIPPPPSPDCNLLTEELDPVLASKGYLLLHLRLSRRAFRRGWQGGALLDRFARSVDELLEARGR